MYLKVSLESTNFERLLNTKFCHGVKMFYDENNADLRYILLYDFSNEKIRELERISLYKGLFGSAGELDSCTIEKLSWKKQKPNLHTITEVGIMNELKFRGSSK